MIIRYLLAFFLLWPYSVLAVGDVFTDDCPITWDAPISGIPPEYYKILWDDSPGDPPHRRDGSFDVLTGLTTSCAELGAAGMRTGQQYLIAQSCVKFDPDLPTEREVCSVASNELPLVWGAPDPPTGLRTTP